MPSVTDLPPVLNWNGKKKTVLKPAQGTVHDYWYFGIPFPVILRKEITGKKGEPTIIEEEGKRLAITNGYNVWLQEDLETMNTPSTFSHEPLFLDERWNFEDIKQFVNGGHASPTTKELLDEIQQQYRNYIDFVNPEDYLVTAAWTMTTYLHQLFVAFPYLFLSGEKESGKTKTLLLTSCMAFNSMTTGNISTSALYRMVQDCSPALLLDETETLKDPERAESIRNVLLSGYKKGTVVYRANKDKKNTPVESFEVYCPKMIANIRGLEQVLESRTIPIQMCKTLDKNLGNKEINPLDPQWPQIRAKLYRWALDHWKEVAANNTPETTPEELTNRAKELWLPILTLLKTADNNYYTTVSEYAKRQQTERAIEAEQNNELTLALLKALSQTIKQDQAISRAHVKAVATVMRSLLSNPPAWLKWRWVSDKMKLLGYQKGRDNVGVFYEITSNQFKATLSRYSITQEYLNGLSFVEETQSSQAVLV